MPATSLYFNGRLTRVPGSYSKVDASALDAVGLGASGYVAIVGTALGGLPYDQIDPDDVAGTIQKSTKPGQAATFFRSGSDLLECESLAFNPSNDPDIEAGAQRVYWVKVNKSTQSTATLNNADGPSMVLTSEDYGYHTRQINAQVGTGTVSGKMYTITFGTTIEIFDNVGGAAIFSCTYLSSTPAQGFTTITLQVTAAQLIAAFTRTQAGLDAHVSNQVTVVGYAASAVIEVVSSDNADTQTVTIYGVDENGDAIAESVALTGTTAVQTTDAFNSFHGARISAAPAGTVTIRNASAGTTITQLTAGNTTRGLGLCTDMPVNSTTVSVVADAGTNRRLTLVGMSAAGAVQVETVTLNGITPVASTLSWSRLDYFAMGDVQAARTVTVSGTAVATLFSGYPTVQDCADKFNGTAGFTFTMITGSTAFQMTNMDIYAATNILSPAAPSFYATLYDAITAINNGSGLVTAARGTPGTSAPSNTTDPVYLSGGHEGSSTPGAEATPYTTAADWTAALAVLKKIFVNTVVVVSATPSVHSDLKDHCAYMAGAGKMERDGVVGLLNAGLTGLASKTEIKSQVIDLNTRHLRAVAQQCERYNTLGVKTKFNPQFTAVLVAGMQAGSSVATSLTHKYINTLGIYGSSTWHPQDDADEMIEMGLLFAETVDGVGRRWVRNITTHLSSDNMAYTEASVNEAANYTAYNFRTQMESAVGKKGFAGTIQAADGVAREVLRQLMADVLTAWRSLDISLVLDVLSVDVEVAPVIPVNFVRNTIHLVSLPQAA